MNCHNLPKMREFVQKTQIKPKEEGGWGDRGSTINQQIKKCWELAENLNTVYIWQDYCNADR